MNFSIIDVETTGFSPRLGDRIIEISIINTDSDGGIINVYETLINPQRDLGACWVHGITSEMVVDAPLFEDIYWCIINEIKGNVIVSHNARFDLGFLNHEFKRVGLEIGDLKGICTVDLSKIIIPHLPSYKLNSLCEYFDIELNNAHSALGDSISTKDLFNELRRRYINLNGYDDFSSGFVENLIVDIGIPIKTIEKKEYKRSNVFQFRKRKDNHLKNMISRLPNNSRSIKFPVQEYLNILDDILADRIVTEEESEKLFTLSDDYQISNEEAIEIHEEYLRRLVRVYLLDKVISDGEYADLVKVSNILGIRNKLDLMIELETSTLKSIEDKEESKKENIEGKSVCFTGQLMSAIGGQRTDRNKAQEMAFEKGLIIKKAVSKNLDFLVVADPHTQSSKARKARELEVKIIAEPVFWKMIGISID